LRVSYPFDHIRVVAKFCAEFNEVQTDKRNAYRNKVAENRAAAQSGHGDDGEVELDRDGQPAAKKARIEPGDSSGMDTSEMPEGYNMDNSRADDEGEEDEGHGDEDEEDEEEPEEPEERLDPLEEADHAEAEDEALDNGDDSD
jgi:DNA polymerase epsilon subunit 3